MSVGAPAMPWVGSQQMPVQQPLAVMTLLGDPRKTAGQSLSSSQRSLGSTRTSVTPIDGLQDHARVEQQARLDGARLAAHQQEQIDKIYHAAEVQKRQLLEFVDEQAKRQEAHLREIFTIQAGGVAQRLFDATMEDRFQAQVAEFEEHVKRAWVYDPDVRAPLDIRALPELDGPRTGVVMMPGETFGVCEVRIGEMGVLFLKLLDGRGWVFERKPGFGTMCRRTSAPAPPSPPGTARSASSVFGGAATGANVWVHRPRQPAPLAIRSCPDVNGPRTGLMLMPGDVFGVSEERESKGSDGSFMLYLKLADGRGWVFDRKPGVGALCHRHLGVDAPRAPSPQMSSWSGVGGAEVGPQLYSQLGPAAAAAAASPMRQRNLSVC